MLTIESEHPERIAQHQQTVEFYPTDKDLSREERVVVKNEEGSLKSVCTVVAVETVDVTEESLRTSKKVEKSGYDDLEQVREEYVDENGKAQMLTYISGHPKTELEVGDEVTLEYQSAQSKNFLEATGPIEATTPSKTGHTIYAMVDMSGNEDYIDKRRLLFVHPGTRVRSAQFDFLSDVEFGWYSWPKMGYTRKRKIGTMSKVRKIHD